MRKKKKKSDPYCEYAKTKDLKVRVSFVRDNSYEGKLRSQAATVIICDLILLGLSEENPRNDSPNRKKEANTSFV